MATYVPAKKNTAYIFYVGLPSQSNALTLQANPTLAAGDVKIAIDDGAPAQIEAGGGGAALPVVDADFTKRVKVTLTAAQMNGDNITVIFSDAAGAEWCDVLVNIQTAANQIDDLGTAVADIPTTSELALRTLLAAEYTVVSDLGTVQSGDSYAIVNGDHGLVSIQDDIDNIPTTTEFELRTLPSDEYVVIGDTIAGVTTCTTNSDLVTAAAIKTALEVDGGDLSSLMEALVNKRVWTELTGTLELHDDGGVSQGTIAAQVTTDGTFTTAKRAVI